jgi:hypothetical protein
VKTKRRKVKPPKRNNWREVIRQFYPEGDVASGIIRDLRKYVAAVKGGADPIEAMHGHICRPGCWHDRMKKAAGEKPSA